MMLRALLAERFGLVMHTEDRPIPAYVLALSKAGSKLMPSTSAESKCQGIPRQVPAGGGPPYSVLTCIGTTMAAFSELLPQTAPGYVNRLVVDHTYLKGAFDFELKWSGRGQLAAGGVSLFDALDQQLGLTLTLESQPLPVMVVDKVNGKPTDNEPDVAQKLPVVPAEFEVADIKPSMPGAMEDGGFQPGGRIDLKAIPLKELVRVAWDLYDDMVVAPKWLDDLRFDIVAKAPDRLSLSTGGSVDVEIIRAMLRALLIDRFKIMTHTENRLVAMYELTTTKGEPKFKRADRQAGPGVRTCMSALHRL